MASLWLSLLLSVLGAGYVVYGRRQKHGAALLCGVGLLVAPYFLPNAAWKLLIGLLLVALPFFLRE